MQSNLHKARVWFSDALRDDWDELPGPDREKAKLLDEIVSAEFFIQEAKARLKEITNG